MFKNRIKSLIGRAVYRLKSQRTANQYKLMYEKMSKSISIKPGFVDNEAVKDYLKKWKHLDKKVSSQGFTLYCNNNSEVDTNYVPDFLFDQLISKILNNSRYDVYYSDKNFDDKRFDGDNNLMPETLLRKIENVYYDGQYSSIDDVKQYLRNSKIERIIAKPSIDSAGGRGIELFVKDKDNKNYFKKNEYELTTWMQGKKNLLIQRVVGQNDFYKKINPDSINTIRVVTYRSVVDEIPVILQSFLRIGGPGAFVDNWHSGGLILAINNDGFFEKYAYDMEFNKTAFPYYGSKAPFIEEIWSTAINLAKSFFFHRIMAFDLFIDDHDQVRLIESNTGAASWLQFIAGPLFGKHTDEVIGFCKENIGSQTLTLPIQRQGKEV